MTDYLQLLNIARLAAKDSSRKGKNSSAHDVYALLSRSLDSCHFLATEQFPLSLLMLSLVAIGGVIVCRYANSNVAIQLHHLMN